MIKSPAAFPKDQSLGPSTHFGWFTTAYNSNKETFKFYYEDVGHWHRMHLVCIPGVESLYHKQQYYHQLQNPGSPQSLNAAS